MAQQSSYTEVIKNTRGADPVRPAPPRILTKLVAQADVAFNGDRPWDVQVYDRDAYRRILPQGTLGLGESFVDGQWDTEQLDELISRLLGARLYRQMRNLMRLRLRLLASVAGNNAQPAHEPAVRAALADSG